MDKNFFDKDINEQLKIMENEKFFSKNELAQSDFLRGKGFFELEMEKRVEFLEKAGIFHIDVNDDPPTIPLTLDKVDYLNKKITSKINREIAYGSAERFLNKIIKRKKLIIKEIKGIERLKNVKTGAIITCNHFNPFDCFAVEYVFRQAGLNKKRRLYKVIREGNYTNFPGLYGYFFKNCDTLPLASNRKVMAEFIKSINTILKRGDFILMYPEQSMWLNYKKPKPLKDGTFKIATKNDVPVIPIFITMQDSNVIGDDGNPVQEYIINIENPIYADSKLEEKEKIKQMKERNFEVWKKVYEDFYGTTLEYTTKQSEVFGEAFGKLLGTPSKSRPKSEKLLGTPSKSF